MIKKGLHSTLERLVSKFQKCNFLFFHKNGKNIEFEEHVLLTNTLPIISEIPVKNSFLVTLTIVLKKRKLLCNYCTLQITQKFVKKLDCMSKRAKVSSFMNDETISLVCTTQCENYRNLLSHLFLTKFS